MKKYLFLLLASVMASTAGAQIMTPLQEREFYQKAYDVMTIYAQSASLGSDQQKYKFTRLFESQNAPVCNDLMPLSDKEKLTMWKYVDLLRKEADEVEVRVMNLRKGTIEDQDSVWTMEVKFDKSISFLNKCYSFFDSDEVFGEPYHMKAILCLNKSTGLCSIRSILSDGKWQNMPEDYRILQKREGSKRDKDLFVNGKRVEYNRYDQVFLRSGDKITYNRGAVKENDLGEECGTKIEVDYKDKSWRIRPNIGFSISGFNKLDGGDGILEASGNSEMSFGVDFGYVFRTAGKFKPGIFIGFGISSNKMTLDSFGTEESFQTTEDEDGDSYQRHYKVWGEEGIHQTMKATDITIPLYVDLEYQFTSLFSAYADLGMKMQSSSGKWEAETGRYETWGVYSGQQYGGNLTIRNYDADGNPVQNPVILNGFGMTNGGAIGIEEQGSAKSTSMDVLIGLGIRLNPSKSFAIDAGIQHLMGGKSWKSDGGPVFSYTLAKGDKVNLLHAANGIKHSALRLTIGFSYKF